MDKKTDLQELATAKTPYAEPDPNRPGRWRVLYHGGAVAKTGLRGHQVRDMTFDGTAPNPSEQLQPVGAEKVAEGDTKQGRCS